MECAKCQGLMVEEKLLDFFLNSDGSTWKCLICGCVTDATIIENQTRRRSLRSGARLNRMQAISQHAESDDGIF